MLIGLITLFFLSNYHICNYFYPLNDSESIELWWIMKLDIYAIIIALCFYVASFKPNDNRKLRLIEKMVSNIGIGLAVSNAFDRHIHDIRDYNITDIIMATLVISFSYYDFVKSSKSPHKNG